MKSIRVIRLGLIIVALIVGFLIAGTVPAHAEGSKELTQNGGYRPYTERYGATTTGVQRQQLLHAAVNKGEHVLLGTSVTGASLTGGSYSAYPDSEIHVICKDNTGTLTGTEYWISVDTQASGNKTTVKKVVSGVLISTDEYAPGTGYIANHSMEASGPDKLSSGGYPAVDIASDTDGTFDIEIFSSSLSGVNPAMASVTSDNFASNQKGSTVAAWDITVTNSTEDQPINGRVWTNKLFLNMGGNKVGQDVLKSKVYVYTDDGFSYAVDFNGMDPYGFVFFANNRGLLYKNSDGTYQSLYHSVVTRDNQMNGLSEHNILLNLVPVTSDDSTYKIFFNTPDKALFPSATSKSFTGASNFKFKGTNSDKENTTFAGDGGTFSFDAADTSGATSYQLTMTFANGTTVLMGNKLNKGATNSVTWDGRDGKGNIVASSSEIKDIKLDFKGGETHFPFMDAENNKNGIKIQNITTGWPNTWTVYYDNVNDNTSRYSDGWSASINNWKTIAGGNNYSASGVSSENGAMKYSSSNQFDWANTGNQAALDMWTYVSDSVDNTWSVKIETQSTSISFKGTKKVSGRPLTSSYGFVVKEGTKTVATGKSNMTDGTITFTSIPYTTTGTHKYTVTETVGNDPNLQYDSSSYTVTVDVTMDSSGNLVAKATYPGGADGLTFTNVYTPDGTSYTIKATKDLVNQGAGTEKLSGDEFTFKLLDSNGNVLQQKKNDADGNIVFDSISYTKAGTYTYYVQEDTTGLPSTTNWVYDTSKHKVQVVVSDVSGTLKVTDVIEPQGGTVIKNLYRESDDSLIFWGTKNLTGRDLKAGEFEFKLYLKSITYKDASGKEVTENIDPDFTSPVHTADNDQTGAAIFSWISYDSIKSSDRATGDKYVYIIKETKGSEKGITYDSSSQEVDVNVKEVTENGTTRISATSSVPSSQGDVTFTNSYAPAPTTVSLSVNKRLTGSTLKKGQFAFYLYDQNGKIIDTATNAANGKVTFDALRFTKAGTYTYTVKEKNTGKTGFTYDKTCRTATVTVTDENASLMAKVTWKDSNNTFINKYTGNNNGGGGGTSNNNGGNSGGTSNNGGGTVNTGDDGGNMLAMWLSLLISSTALAYVLGRLREYCR